MTIFITSVAGSRRVATRFPMHSCSVPLSRDMHSNCVKKAYKLYKGDGLSGDTLARLPIIQIQPGDETTTRLCIQFRGLQCLNLASGEGTLGQRHLLLEMVDGPAHILSLINLLTPIFSNRQLLLCHAHDSP